MSQKVFWTSITILFFSLFEASVLSNLAWLPILPDLVLIVVVYVSFINGSMTGATTGFIGGLMVDFLSAAPVGLNSFIRSLTGYLFGKFSGMFNLDRLLTPALMVCAATILKMLQVRILSFFFGSLVINYQLAHSHFWLEILINSLSAPIIFWLLSQFPSLYGNFERKD